MPTICMKCNKNIKRSPEEKSISCIKCLKSFHLKCINHGESSKQKSDSYTCENCSVGNNEVDFIAIVQNMQKDVGNLMGNLKNLQSLSEKVSKNSKKIEEHEENIQYLKNELDVLQLRERQRNVVITGVPLLKSECAVTIVLQIAKFLDVELSTDSVDKCFRFQAKAGGLKPILVSFNTIHTRNLFLAAFKTKNCIRVSDIGYSGTEKVIIGEHITNTQRQLLTSTKEELISTSIFKYAWIQNGAVLVRTDGDGKIKKIRCLADIQKLKRNNILSSE